MGKSLNLIVLAEGVEDRQQLEFLREHDCSMYQGYYFSKPLEPEALHKIVSSQQAASQTASV